MLFETVRDNLAKQFEIDPETITAETNIVDDLGADSLDVVELTMSLEEEFDLPEIPEEELKAIESVGDLVDYVEKNVKE